MRVGNPLAEGGHLLFAAGSGHDAELDIIPVAAAFSGLLPDALFHPVQILRMHQGPETVVYMVQQPGDAVAFQNAHQFVVGKEDLLVVLGFVHQQSAGDAHGDVPEVEAQIGAAFLDHGSIEDGTVSAVEPHMGNGSFRIGEKLCHDAALIGINRVAYRHAVFVNGAVADQSVIQGGIFMNHFLRLLRIGIRHENIEGIAAVADDDSFFAEDAADFPNHDLQQRVACFRSVKLVKQAQIDDDQLDQVGLSVRMFPDVGLDHFVAAVIVEHSGQTVSTGNLLQEQLFGPLLLMSGDPAVFPEIVNAGKIKDGDDEGHDSLRRQLRESGFRKEQDQHGGLGKEHQRRVSRRNGKQGKEGKKRQGDDKPQITCAGGSRSTEHEIDQAGKNVPVDGLVGRQHMLVVLFVHLQPHDQQSPGDQLEAESDPDGQAAVSEQQENGRNKDGDEHQQGIVEVFPGNTLRHRQSGFFNADGHQQVLGGLWILFHDGLLDQKDFLFFSMLHLYSIIDCSPLPVPICKSFGAVPVGRGIGFFMSGPALFFRCSFNFLKFTRGFILP